MSQWVPSERDWEGVKSTVKTSPNLQQYTQLFNQQTDWDIQKWCGFVPMGVDADVWNHMVWSALWQYAFMLPGTVKNGKIKYVNNKCLPVPRHVYLLTVSLRYIVQGVPSSLTFRSSWGRVRSHCPSGLLHNLSEEYWRDTILHVVSEGSKILYTSWLHG